MLIRRKVIIYKLSRNINFLATSNYPWEYNYFPKKYQSDKKLCERVLEQIKPKYTDHDFIKFLSSENDSFMNDKYPNYDCARDTLRIIVKYHKELIPEEIVTKIEKFI